jgi:hypothetical protein
MTLGYKFGKGLYSLLVMHCNWISIVVKCASCYLWVAVIEDALDDDVVENDCYSCKVDGIAMLEIRSFNCLWF